MHNGAGGAAFEQATPGGRHFATIRARARHGVASIGRPLRAITHLLIGELGHDKVGATRLESSKP
jgi:hypothetical protein